MRTLFVTEFLSTDGVMEAPGGEEGYRHAGWTFSQVEPDDTPYEFKAQETYDSEALLLGRTTYEGFAAAWPERDGEFADRFNSMPKYVVSSTLTDPTWANTTVLRSVDDVAALKDGDGGPIAVHGSGTLARSLAAAGLVDRYHLMVFPVVLGSGRRLFADDAEELTRLRLLDSTTYENGVQVNRYDVVR